jgi:hypothetical protein
VIPHAQILDLHNREAKPELRETFPEVRETISEVRETFPDVRETIPEVREDFPEVRGTISEVRERFPEVRETIPDIREMFPVIFSRSILNMIKGFKDVQDFFLPFNPFYPSIVLILLKPFCLRRARGTCTLLRFEILLVT